MILTSLIRSHPCDQKSPASAFLVGVYSLFEVEEAFATPGISSDYCLLPSPLLRLSSAAVDALTFIMKYPLP